MTTKEKIAVMQAAADGKQIQFTTNGSSWSDLADDENKWNWAWCQYRIKPTPKLRAWKGGSEVRQSSILIRQKNFGSDSWSWQVCAVQHDGFAIMDSKGCRTIGWQELADKYEHSFDLGLTWKECGILE